MARSQVAMAVSGAPGSLSWVRAVASRSLTGFRSAGLVEHAPSVTTRSDRTSLVFMTGGPPCRCWRAYAQRGALSLQALPTQAPRRPGGPLSAGVVSTQPAGPPDGGALAMVCDTTGLPTLARPTAGRTSAKGREMGQSCPRLGNHSYSRGQFSAQNVGWPGALIRAP